MVTPPIPPRPYDSYQRYQEGYSRGRQSSLPPPIPPLPADFKPADEPLAPHLTEPLVAPRPTKIISDVPADMARKLDDQVLYPSIGISQPMPGFHQPPKPDPYRGPSSFAVGGFASPPLRMAPPSPQPPQAWLGPPPLPQTYATPHRGGGTLGISQSMQNLSFGGPSQQQHHPHGRSASHANLPPSNSFERRRSPPRKNSQGLPAITAKFPTVESLAESQHVSDPAHQVKWCRDVLWLVERFQQTGGTSPPQGPAKVSDPQLQYLAEFAVKAILRIAPALPLQSPPPYISEAVYLRGKLASSGAFPDLLPANPREAFRLFEASARAGYAPGWFQLGRDYESVNDFNRARDCFERGAKAGVESCYYRLGMAHLLGQLNLPADIPKAVPLLHNAALNASIDVPQPAYVYGLLLLSEFPHVTIPAAFFFPYLPAGTTPQMEARKHIEQAAYLGFSPAQYKMGHAYEYAIPPFPFDPLLSVQYYSQASQQGEDEADMALSKWFLCGAEGAFDKDENLAYVFAEKAARRGLPTAQFALGYYAEVGVGRSKDLEVAQKWYTKAAEQGNTDAADRLQALSHPSPQTLSRQEHEDLTDAKLVRRRTQARNNAAAQGRIVDRTNEVHADDVVGAIRKNSLLHRQGPQRYSTEPRQDGQLAPEPVPILPGDAAGPLQPSSSPQVRTGPRVSSRPGRTYQAPTTRPVNARRPSAETQGMSSLPSDMSSDPQDVALTPRPQPSKGPSTFQEMGFQSHKLQEKECLIM